MDKKIQSKLNKARKKTTKFITGKQLPYKPRKPAWEYTNRAYTFALIYRYLGREPGLDYYYGTKSYRGRYSGMVSYVLRGIRNGGLKEIAVEYV